ncbi:MAG TPA: hypothetical protein VN028_06435, partial [Rhodocyclaceae bacterium]|nr:hypothetical protein [Rhodocyclaceae bacterium]
MKLRSCRPRISALLGFLLLGLACVAPATQAAQTAPEGDKSMFNTAPATELTPEILYQFMFAELAGTRGQLALSVAAYLDLARTTRDPKIARRAAEVALH